MKVKVTLFVAGKVFDEKVYATDYDDAKRTAIARNPSATVVSVTAVFD
tara:strand:- start:1656 stop:1799 length:144 start_codon:yes stop_codon:yes gene_type:complete